MSKTSLKFDIIYQIGIVKLHMNTVFAQAKKSKKLSPEGLFE